MAADEVFVGYVPAFREVRNWRPGFRRQRTARNGAVARQVIWNCTTDANQRLLVDVTEEETAKGALIRVDTAMREKSVRLEPGPDRFGPRSFVYPQVHAVSVDFAWANLAICVFSCGVTQAPVEDWVERILGELNTGVTPGLRQAVVLQPVSRPVAQSGATYVSFSVPWDRGEGAWWKFMADGGTLALTAQRDRLVLAADHGRADPAITALSIEPGRETCWGRYP